MSPNCPQAPLTRHVQSVANEQVQIPVQQSVLNAQRIPTSRQRPDRHVPFSQMPVQH
jgi:hypothetical protein